VLVTLDAPYTDTSAAELCLALTAPELTALHVLDLPPPASGLRLRLLGASHQVVLRPPDGPELIETVACLPGRVARLPAELDDPAAGYRFAARIKRLAPTEFAARIAALRDALADDPYALVGVFPGGPDAVTALRARTPGVDGVPTGGEVGWRTWHAYPQNGELVETETVVSLR
jgi:hypothetical protein